MTDKLKITPTYLRTIIQKIINDVKGMGLTQLQLCQAAGLKRDSLSKMKNPKIETIIKLMEARDRLKKKIKTIA